MIWRSGKFLGLHNCMQRRWAESREPRTGNSKGKQPPFAQTSGCERRLKANSKAASIERPSRRRANDWSRRAPELRSDRGETVRPGRMQQVRCPAGPKHRLTSDRVSPAEIAPVELHTA